MTNMQLYLAIGIPALLILSNTGAMFFLFAQNNTRMDRLEARMDRIEARIGQIEADLRHFFSITGAHTEAIETLKKRL